MKENQINWANIVAGAQNTVERAQSGDANAGFDVIAESVLALRGWLELDERPDQHRLVYLRGLLASLERIEAGVNATEALHIKQGHRRRNNSIGVRDAVLFVEVGQESDRLKYDRGHTRNDKPVEAALKTVAKVWHLRVPTVRKAWNYHGGASSWTLRKADWK